MPRYRATIDFDAATCEEAVEIALSPEDLKKRSAVMQIHNMDEWRTLKNAVLVSPLVLAILWVAYELGKECFG